MPEGYSVERVRAEVAPEARSRQARSRIVGHRRKSQTGVLAEYLSIAVLVCREGVASYLGGQGLGLDILAAGSHQDLPSRWNRRTSDDP